MPSFKMLTVLIISLSLLKNGDASQMDCIDVCLAGIDVLNAACSQLLGAAQCFHDNPVLCNLSQPLEEATYSIITNHINLMSCHALSTTPPPSSTQNCRTIPSQNMGPFDEAVTKPAGIVAPTCTDQSSTFHKQLQHCSVFLDGYLRPFPAYRNGLQSCSIPGSWILFRHEKLLVEVEGTDLLGRVGLTKVNVTVYADGCNGETSRSYVAITHLNLPMTFTDGYTHTDENSALQLHVNGTVASILVVYKNFTIVIRQKDFMLSVTLQVPGRDSFFSDGLCSGCPEQQVLDISSVTRGAKTCPEYFTLVLACFEMPAFTSLRSITNASYYDVCTPALYQAISANTRTFINSVGMDAVTLSDDGVFPSPPPNPISPRVPTSPTSKESTSRAPLTTELATSEIARNMEAVNRTIELEVSGSSHASPLSWLLGCSLLVAAALPPHLQS